MAEDTKGFTQRENAAGWYRKFHISDYVTLLHLPFSSTLIAFAIIGGAMAPSIHADRLIMAVIIVFFAHQGSHYLDEAKGHPWNTKISDRTLYSLSFLFLAIAIITGIYLLILVSPLLILFFIPLVFFPIAYSMELWNGRFHRPLSFGISSALVCLGSYFLQSLSISWSSIFMSVAIGIQSSYIIILYESTKADSTKNLAWNTLKGIVIMWIFIAASMLLLRIVG
jgi:1,4-dihydroxy-2-naphthoate octaprenyltransferase